MITFEKVEKLREYAGISYEEAKKELEKTDGDLLEAVVNLEKEGRIKKPEANGYYKSSGQEKTEESMEKVDMRKEEKTRGSNFTETLKNILSWVRKLIEKGNSNNFKIIKDDNLVLEIPLTAFALLLFFAFWIVIPAMVIGLVFGYRYNLGGPDLDETKVNKAMDSVSDATRQAVDSMTDAAGKFSKDDKKPKGENNNGENSNC
ncbi:DUF4342 domain-containing protein [Halanaerobiaceae bacterium Z-7014]|uniref:DUF4342 domain-containing protein n=1 Tax=Halonatronomonas betaini TaxID=2778430 RepID=A0A931F8B5_9FIRM|nr:DUF4342 domain-containing protein [Halonatronomonas betaini]